MKKFHLLIALLLCVRGFSQISLDFRTSVSDLTPVKLSNSETKFFEDNPNKIRDMNEFSLYNLDGTIFKTIQLPPKPDTNAGLQVYYISRTLFDNDPANIEYLICYYWDSTYNSTKFQTTIAREDGTVLLNELNARPSYSTSDVYAVCNTEAGSKLILFYTYAYWNTFIETKVFNLPGTLPNAVKDESGILQNDFTLYPNPNNGSFFIEFLSNPTEASTINLYSQNGNLINTFNSTKKSIMLDNVGLSDGIYLINVRSRNSFSTRKIMIQK
jgi:hypothetical protein